MPNTMTPVQKETQVSTYLCISYETARGLQSAVQDLKTRISPIMRDASMETPKTSNILEEIPIPILVPLASNIRDINNIHSATIKEIYEIIDLIEL